MTDSNDERKSSIPGLYLLHTLESFQQHALELIKLTRQRLVILSSELDPLLFNSTEVCDALSRMVRNHRQAELRILVKNTQPLVTGNHKLLQLHRRLPSKVQIRKLMLEPQNSDMAYIIGDRSVVLMKNDDRVYEGFINYQGKAEAKHFLEEFDYLWHSHSKEDQQLREFIL